ncbi:alpha/beta hydrolase [Chlorobium sp.]|jgi:S-formylglutathione hydrolase FrmB|uniref:alpha/beta hydrolase n=1 Tax=Chlorobium sp. TaxID=1095 RepID=UPI003C5698B6
MSAGSARRPRITTAVVPGRTLAGNPLGDPEERSVPVYLPPSYDGSRRFPVIYLLSGFASTGASFMNYRFGTPTVPEMAERLIAEGRMPECMIVMPDCMTRFGGSQYVDSAATGRYESYLVGELVPFIDSTFATLPRREHRAIAGKSSGGFGALRLAMKHPRCFSAVACHSGDMHFELCYRPNFPLAARILERHGGSISAFLEAYESALKKPGNEFALLDIIAMAAAYSPGGDKPAPENMRLPFDPHTCEIIEDVWQEWLAFDPIRMLECDDCRRSLQELSLLHLDCGSYDEYNLQFGHRIFSAKAKRCGIAHSYEEFPDSHGDTSYRYEVSLPRLSGAISA